MRKLIYAVVFLSLIVSTLPLANAQDLYPPQPFDATHDITLYQPSKIVISFAYADNIDVSDVGTLGKSLYTITHTPVQFIFEPRGLDTYTLIVDIRYDNITAQTVTLGIFSADQAPDSENYIVKTNHIRFRFTITSIEKPEYPTSDDIAYVLAGQLRGIIEQNQWDLREAIKGLKTLGNNVAIISFAAVIAVAGVILFIVYYTKPVVAYVKSQLQVEYEEEEEGEYEE